MHSGLVDRDQPPTELGSQVSACRTPRTRSSQPLGLILFRRLLCTFRVSNYLARVELCRALAVHRKRSLSCYSGNLATLAKRVMDSGKCLLVSNLPSTAGSRARKRSITNKSAHGSR